MTAQLFKIHDRVRLTSPDYRSLNRGDIGRIVRRCTRDGMESVEFGSEQVGCTIWIASAHLEPEMTLSVLAVQTGNAEVLDYCGRVLNLTRGDALVPFYPDRYPEPDAPYRTRLLQHLSETAEVDHHKAKVVAELIDQRNVLQTQVAELTVARDQALADAATLHAENSARMATIESIAQVVGVAGRGDWMSERYDVFVLGSVSIARNELRNARNEAVEVRKQRDRARSEAEASHERVVRLRNSMIAALHISPDVSDMSDDSLIAELREQDDRLTGAIARNAEMGDQLLAALGYDASEVEMTFDEMLRQVAEWSLRAMRAEGFAEGLRDGHAANIKLLSERFNELSSGYLARAEKAEVEVKNLSAASLLMLDTITGLRTELAAEKDVSLSQEVRTVRAAMLGVLRLQGIDSHEHRHGTAPITVEEVSRLITEATKQEVDDAVALALVNDAAVHRAVCEGERREHEAGEGRRRLVAELGTLIVAAEKHQGHGRGWVCTSEIRRVVTETVNETEVKS